MGISYKYTYGTIREIWGHKDYKIYLFFEHKIFLVKQRD